VQVGGEAAEGGERLGDGGLDSEPADGTHPGEGTGPARTA
jgi:hypothetical protein